MGEIQKIVEGMDPKEAAGELAEALKKLFLILDEQERTDVVMNLVGESEGDKLSGMVHL